MPNSQITDIFSQLKRDEGTKLFLYKDDRGFDTIGTGHNCDANPLPFDVSDGITPAQNDQILTQDVNRTRAKLIAALPWSIKLDDARFGVFLNMSFNMGVGGLLNFHHDITDTMAGNYVQAAADMQQSAWYNQVGARAVRLCEQMRTGVWQ